MSFKTLEEFYKFIKYLEELDCSKENLFKLKNFLKFSPNKFARKLGIDEIMFQKEFNQIKKRIHRKYLYDKEVYNLSKLNPNKKTITHMGTFGDDFASIRLEAMPCICIKDLMKKGEAKFYKTIKYLYYLLSKDGYIISKNHIVLSEHEHKIYLTEKEFEEHFLDLREYKLKQLLD